MDMGEGTRSRVVRAPQLDELRLFSAAAELGSVGRAAKRMHLSQPGASKRLKALEELVGAELLERSAKGVTLTAAGERLYAQARKVSAAVEEMLGVVEELRGRHATVRLAISHTAAEYLLPRALVLMQQRTSAPVEVLAANSHVVKRMIAAGEADLGVAALSGGERIAGLTSTTLFEDEVVVAVPLAHPWARRGSVTVEELIATPIVQRDPSANSRQALDEALAELDIAPIGGALEVGSTQAAKEEAHERCLPAVLSRLAFSVADRLEIVPVDGLKMVRCFCILQAHGAVSSSTSELIAALHESAELLGGGSAR